MYTFSLTSALSLGLFLSGTLGQTETVTGVSQISDGQVQAPTASATIPSDTVTSSVPYENPFTIYLTQTDSLGVITGHPSVVTSQPEVVTSQPPVATNPTLSGYWYGNSTTTASSSHSSAAATTLETSTVSGSSSGSGSGSSSGTRTASATVATSTGGAVSNHVTGAGMALVLLGCGFFIL